MPNFEKFNIILPMHQLLLKVSGSLVEGFWSNPESPACNVSFRCSFFRMSRKAILVRTSLTDMGSTGRKYVLNLEWCSFDFCFGLQIKCVGFLRWSCLILH